MVLTFSSGASDGSMECVNVTIINDDALEANQTFSVTITEHNDAVEVVNVMTTVTITDNDSTLRLY